ncbi:Asp/Glu/hydantoin racemase [Sordaria brevicollis]|uniref:Asp/Glu/hydantoin racemase n=1 Tax=Sordaria brevicollis TaxID=83679 RepID=A0AAE0NV40_SORBR|nr:Asp/Glu/hydantoin racemase [Sordaria brevicollis]
MSASPDEIKILILNPNSSASMTEGMQKSISTLNLPDNITLTYYTAPSSSPASINDGADVQLSASVVLNDLGSSSSSLLQNHDAVLVCCFSIHPLVTKLTEYASSNLTSSLSVTGIFESSLLTSLSLLTSPSRKWGIVTTGKFWESHLTSGVKDFLGQSQPSQNEKFAGVETTGLNAGDFHGDIPQSVIDAKLAEATRRLLKRGDVECVVMGCAGMAGLEEIIRRVAVEEYGEERGRKVMVVDGVRAGVGLLGEMVRWRRMFSQ